MSELSCKICKKLLRVITPTISTNQSFHEIIRVSNVNTATYSAGLFFARFSGNLRNGCCRKSEFRGWEFEFFSIWAEFFSVGSEFSYSSEFFSQRTSFFRSFYTCSLCLGSKSTLHIKKKCHSLHVGKIYTAIIFLTVAGNLSFWKNLAEFWKKLTWVLSFSEFFLGWVYEKCAKNKPALIKYLLFQVSTKKNQNGNNGRRMKSREHFDFRNR